MPADPATSAFYAEFLTELKAVDDFLAQRTGGAGHVRREDPDVRRLIESIAFFSARTRQAATDQVRRAVLSLARGHLDDFLSPQPARGLVQAVPQGLLTETVQLPAGTRLRLTTEDGDLGLFSTMIDVTLRPIELDLAELQLRRGGGFRLVLRIRARRDVRHIPEPLAIHLNVLGDYRASLRFQHALRDSLRPGSVSVFYGAAPEPSRIGAPCEIRFGGAPRADAGAELAVSADEVTDASAVASTPDSPIDQLRTFLHFPAKDLTLQLALPAPARSWRQAWLCFDLDDHWPASELVVNKDIFRLFVIPIENLVRDAALPIKCDGTRAQFAIAPARADAGLALHSVIGVFQETPAGRDPILPVQLASGDASYDLEQPADELDAFAPQLVLRLPDAFTAPRLISVEARWHQPGFDHVAVGKLEVKLQTRHVPGIDLQLLGTLTPHRQSELWRDPAAMLQVLSHRASRVLQRRDLINLLSLLGADQDSHHADCAAELLHVETYQEPADLRRGGGIRDVYRITLAAVEDDRRALLEDYLGCVETLLDAWRSNPVKLELQWRTAGARPLMMLGSGT